MTPAEELAPPLAHRWRKILCAIDFSEPSRAALQLAADLARRLGAELTIVHVRDDTAEPDPENTERELERKIGRAKLVASEYLDAPIRAKVLAGTAANEILSYARQGAFDLIVTGTHGRTGVRRVALGSVAERILRNASCPVLVTRVADATPERAPEEETE